MDIKLVNIKVKELVENYVDDDENGVLGYNKKLNIRPKYQREFIYDDQKAKAVIKTITKGFPLNVMYWCKNDDGTFELLDGQQRTISICRFVTSAMYSDKYFNSTLPRGYNNLTKDEREVIDNYNLMIYICEGSEAERLDWFKTINIAGLKLTDQELRNAQYTGEWLTDAKRHFSKLNCPGYNLGKDYINGECDRQAYLEEALSWIADSKKTTIEDYMKDHQHSQNCNELWLYYNAVITWTNTIFGKIDKQYRKFLKGLPIGIFYNKYSSNDYDPSDIAKRVKELMLDSEVQSKKGIFEYLLSGNEKTLSLRTFDDGQKLELYDKCKGLCVRCKSLNKPTKNKVWDITEMEADHIIPWHKGGKTTLENGQMLCVNCNREKSGK